MGIGGKINNNKGPADRHAMVAASHGLSVLDNLSHDIQIGANELQAIETYFGHCLDQLLDGKAIIEHASAGEARKGD